VTLRSGGTNVAFLPESAAPTLGAPLMTRSKEPVLLLSTTNYSDRDQNSDAAFRALSRSVSHRDILRRSVAYRSARWACGSVLTALILSLLILTGWSRSVLAQSNPILFVTQVPVPQDFGTSLATFGNHSAHQKTAGRGGDLYIRYADGSLKNLTAAAGYGNSGFQGAGSIAVRDPAVHWNGQKALFSMAVGSPAQRYETTTYYWQIYEITGLGSSDTPVITKVANQPTDYNNIMPIYGTNGRIIYVSDRPLTGERHLYPQRDEYEASPVVSGLWSLDPASGDLFILDHSPSGDFHPIIDSFGRVVFTRWDHLQRDQENIGVNFGAFNYSSEASSATSIGSAPEVFPEARTSADPDKNPLVDAHTFNHFFPWMMNENGMELETLNHIGRHELHSYIPRSFNNDSNVIEYYQQYSRTNSNPILNFFHIREDPTHLGTYIGIDAPEFGTHASGQIISLSAPPSTKAGDITVTYLTHRDTATSDDTPSANHIGLSRTPLITSDGILIASHTANTLQDQNIGSSSQPASRFDFRIKTMTKVGAYYVPGTNLTSGITKSVSFWDPDATISYTNVTMWELQPVEVVARTQPTTRSEPALESPESSVFTSKGVTESELRAYLAQNNLALLVSRNVTTRDKLDRQQPFNLQIAGSSTKTVGASGKIYDIAHLQFFIGRLIRGYTQATSGRRTLAQEMSEATSLNPATTGPVGSVALGSDGSMAAFVPARRALSWHLTDSDGNPVVRERYWVTFQPGEIRVCASCHGITSASQANSGVPMNAPEALGTLLDFYKAGGPQPTPTSPGTSPTASRVTLRVKKLGGASYRLSGIVTSSAGSGMVATVSLQKISGKQTSTMTQATADSEGRFSFRVRTRRAMRLRATTGSVRSSTVTVGGAASSARTRR